MTSPNAALKERMVSLTLTVFDFSSLVFLFLIFLFILIEGLPLFFKVGIKHIILGFKWAPTRGSFGIFPMIVSSCMVTVGALLIGGPLGLGCAIYLAEYAGKKGRIYLKPSLELLAGIPSVVYGFLGVVYIVPLIREQLGGSGFVADHHLDGPAKGGNIKGAKQIGTLIAERLAAKGIKQVVFDRSGFLYHRRNRAVAEAARAAGLEF